VGGWFGNVVHDAIDPGGLLSGAESRAGDWLDDGAHAVGGALSDVGLGGAGQWVDRAGDDVADFLGAQVTELKSHICQHGGRLGNLPGMTNGRRTRSSLPDTS
jgi:hypothetical protein